MNDMDLWVLPPDYPRLVVSLIHQGFERDVLYPNTFRKGEAVLDIHTHILWADRIKSRKYLLKARQEEVFRKSMWVTTDNGRVRCLSDPDQFLYLSLHALKHNFERLIWLVDIKHLIRDWNASQWGALARRAQILGQEHIVCYVAYLLKNIFKLGIPTGNDDRPAAHKLSLFEERILKRRVNGSPIPTWSQMILISTGKSVKVRLFFMIETLFPRAEVLRQVFTRSQGLSVPRLYWKRVLQMFGLIKAGS